jgi:energy-coupling factor transporter ATP-binding protein EcfA2
MIRINQLTYRYPGAEIDALNIQKLTIPAGKFCLLIGESGSGKSTLLRLFNGLVPHFTGGTLSGKIEVAGLDPITSGPQLMSGKVGFVFQEVENQFVVELVEDEIAFSLEQAAIPRPEMQRRIQEILQRLNLTHLKNRMVENLSGGEAQKVAIAAALVLEPKILVLDEPTSQLDPQTSEEVLLLLKKIQTELGLTIVMSEQRLDRVLSYADMVALLSKDGHLVGYGEPRKVIQISPLKPPVVLLAEQKGWIPIPLDVDQAKVFIQTRPSFLKKVEPKVQTSQPILEVKHLRYQINNREVLKDISFELHQQERLVLMGPNGAGKSTLLRTLIGLIQPEQGEILIKGKEIASHHTSQLSRSIGYLPQDPNALLFSETVEQELQTTLDNHQMTINQDFIHDLLSQLNLQTKIHAYPRDLSTGEKQRVALGAVVVTQPEIIIMDEPTRGLDQITKDSLIKLLFDWNHQGKTILLVTHDVEFAASFATRIIILEDGKIIDQGRLDRVMRENPRYSPQIARLFPDTDWITLKDVID